MKYKVLIFILALHVNLFANDLHVKILENFLGIAYRIDGTTTDDEFYTTFNDQNKSFKKAGLNCSGFVHTASKFLLGQSFSIDEVRKDINKNSYKNSPLGEDWDFGRDLILNIASKFPHKFINPSDVDINSSTSDGFLIDDMNAWKKIFKQIKKQNIYLVTFSKPTNLKGYKYLYYHVGIIIKDNNNNIFLYHATPKQGVHKTWLNFDSKMTPFFSEYKQSAKFSKKILILELQLDKHLDE